MSTTKDFHLGDILSVTGDRLVSPRLIEGVYDVMNWLTGESLFTHQLVTARAECRAELLRQHPQLAAVSDEDVTKESWREWLDKQMALYGETLPVAPMAKHEPRYDTPVADLIEMVGDATKVVVVEP